MRIAICVPLLVTIMTISTVPAHASVLCGRHYKTASGLEATLRAIPGVLVFDKDKGITTIFSPNRTLWWFTSAATRHTPPWFAFARLNGMEATSGCRSSRIAGVPDTKHARRLPNGSHGLRSEEKPNWE